MTRGALLLCCTILLAAAPAVAQQTPQREIDPEFAVPAPGQQWRFTPNVQGPPPEGFYRDNPNAHDLLLRPTPFPDLIPIEGSWKPCRRPGDPAQMSEEIETAFATCLKQQAEHLEKFLAPPGGTPLPGFPPAPKLDR